MFRAKSEPGGLPSVMKGMIGDQSYWYEGRLVGGPRQLRQPSITLSYPYKTHTTPEPALAIPTGLGPNLSLVAFCHERNDCERKLLVVRDLIEAKGSSDSHHHHCILRFG